MYCLYELYLLRQNERVPLDLCSILGSELQEEEQEQSEEN